MTRGGITALVCEKNFAIRLGKGLVWTDLDIN